MTKKVVSTTAAAPTNAKLPTGRLKPAALRPNSDRPSRETRSTRKPRHRGPARRRRIEASCLADDIQPLAETLRKRVVGQEAALDSLTCSFSRLLSGLRDPHRPLLTAMLLGPTGVGKSETARAIAEGLLGKDEALLRIHCEEFSHGHEVAKLLGSPPGYVGQEVEPLLSQERIDAAHTELLEDVSAEPSELLRKISEQADGAKVSVILFDEIEKAHPAVWNALLGLLEDGEVTLGSNRRTQFQQSIILMTSNVGSAEMSELLDGQSLGFAPAEETRAVDPESVRRSALTAAHKRFPPEFLNRFDEVLVYGSLERQDLHAILQKLLAQLHERALAAGTPFLLRLDSAAESKLLDEGTDPRFGARPLRRAVDRELIGPLSRLIAAKELTAGEVVDVEVDDDAFAFFVTSRNDRQVIA